ncbi:sensor histidine kinase [Amycolatopsis sp. NPDC059021]|uniref:sensor histidine kinase n=1 Tax=Amycolatopsis sp. NPDC059021 TaxID=3346704 RepID=UPI00366EC16B
MKRWPLRIRLTVAYTALSAITGAVLLGLIMLLSHPARPAGTAGLLPSDPLTGEVRPVPVTPPEPIPDLGTVTYSSLFQNGAIALGAVMALAAVLGWFTARRALRPVRSITAAAQRAADQELGTRIRLPGPHDEIKELADAFDHMLARLERSFAGQRRFIANAAHELKTPVAAQRAVTEVAIARPDTAAETVALGRKVLAGLDRQERVLAGLLALAQNAETVRKNDIVDLAGLADDILGERLARGGEHLTLRPELAETKVRGDAVLLEQLVRNLVDNAFIHNGPGGWVSVHTAGSATTCVLEIANTGPHIRVTDGDELFEPFRRSCFDRADPPPGSGLGLSVVRAIAEAHGGCVAAQPRTEGGLVVRVSLPAA